MGCQPRLDRAEATGEFLVGVAEAGFGVEIEFAGEVDQHEQQIPDLVGQAGFVGSLEFGAQFSDFLVEFFEHGGGVRPIEPDAGGAAGEFVGAGEGGEGEGDAGEGAGFGAGGAFGLFLGFPGGGLGGGVAGRGVTEDVGVAADHFVGDGAGDVGEGEAAFLGGHLGVVDDLEEEVAEFIGEGGEIASGDGVGDFVGFLDGVGGDGVEGLLNVPRAAGGGGAEGGHDVEEAAQFGFGFGHGAATFRVVWREWMCHAGRLVAKRPHRELSMLMSRRTAIAAGLTAAVAPVVSDAAQPLAGKQAPSFFRSKVGEFEITAINDGQAQRPLDGFIKNAPIEEVRKVLGDAFMAQDKITIPFTSVVVNTGAKLVLLDSGNGDLGAPTTGSWMANFRAAGFDPDKVDAVLISHFHGDHINGTRLKDGRAVFPNAEMMVSAPEWDFWMDDGKMAQAPEGMKPAFNNVRRVFAPMAKDVKRFDWGKELVAGISAVAAPGHTPGHTVFAVQSGSAKFLMMSDLTNNTAVFVRKPDWQAIVDMDGEVARQTRHRMLDMAASEKMQVAFYHAPFPATGHIARDGANGYQLVPAFWQPLG